MGAKRQHQTCWIWICVLVVVIAGAAGFVWWYQGYSRQPVTGTNQAATQNNNQLIGGPCTYASYPGTCKITAVETVSDQPAGGNDGAKLKFTFALNKGETITQSGFELASGKVYEKMAARNGAGDKVGWQACLDEFQIRPGMTYDCTLQAITAGTCTPEIYKFKDLDDKCLMY